MSEESCFLLICDCCERRQPAHKTAEEYDVSRNPQKQNYWHMNLTSPRHPAARHTALSNPSQSLLSTKCTWTFQGPKPQSHPGSRLVQQLYSSSLQYRPSFAQEVLCLSMQLLSCKANLFSSAYSNPKNGQMVADATLPVCPQSATQMLLRTQPAHSACCRSVEARETLYVCLAAALSTVLCAAYKMLSRHAFLPACSAAVG